MVTSLQELHNKHYIHQDIKPENFVVGTGKNANKVYLIDFGLAKRFRDASTGLHIPFKDHKSFTGTARYASINTHLGIEQSRRDDLESLGYLLIYLLKGSLPWQNLPGVNKKDKYANILKTKLSLSIKELCKGLPQEFETYMTYCRNMKFNERPDYSYILRKFRELFMDQGYIYDKILYWEPEVEASSNVQIHYHCNQKTIEKKYQKSDKKAVDPSFLPGQERTPKPPQTPTGSSTVQQERGSTDATMTQGPNKKEEEKLITQLYAGN